MRNIMQLLLILLTCSSILFGMEEGPFTQIEPHSRIDFTPISSTLSCCGLWTVAKETGSYNEKSNCLKITYTILQQRPFLNSIELDDMRTILARSENHAATRVLLDALCSYAEEKGITMISYEHSRDTTVEKNILTSCGFKRLEIYGQVVYVKNFLHTKNN